MPDEQPNKKKRIRSPGLSETHKKYLIDPEKIIETNLYYLPPDIENKLTSEPSTSNTSKTIEATKIPPIYLHTVNNYQAIIADIKQLISGEFTTQYRTNSLKINVTSSDDFRKLTAYYDTKQVKYYTYQHPDKSNMSVIIRNIPISLSENEIADTLKLNYNVVKVVRLLNKNKMPIPICAIEIKKDGKENDIYKLDRLFHSIIEVQPRRKTSSIPQCTRCQRYGHTKNYCKLDPRCVKCLEPHHYSECPKRPNEQPLCVNCGENHTANYKGCRYYINIKQQREQTQENKSQNRKVNTTSNTNTITNIQNKSYANALINPRKNIIRQEQTTTPNDPLLTENSSNPTISSISQIIIDIITPFIEQIKQFITSLFSSLFNGK